MKSARSIAQSSRALAAQRGIALRRQTSTASAASSHRASFASLTHRCTTVRPLLASRWHASATVAPAQSRQYASESAAAAPGALRRTPLYDLHLAHGGKMVPFGGFEMPVQYSSLSVSASHNFTREKASLFDVSHMVQRHFSGPGAAAFLETITPSNVEGLGVHRSTLSTFLHEGTGGIVDDTIITKLGPQLYYVVTNAGCREKDDAYLAEQLQKFEANNSAKVKHEELAEWGLVALQGPLSKDILTEVLADHEEIDLPTLHFGSSIFARVRLQNGELSEPLLISRGGYTGEDGFEISIPPEETVPVTETLLQVATPERLQFAGLGARDSLRLEAGMCLYGHDLDDTTTPVEAGLSWIIPKERRTGSGYYGAAVLKDQLTPKSKGGKGVERRRIGLTVTGAPAREGADIVNEAGEKIGVITSGCPSPTLGKNIAMGYIRDGLHKAGTEVGVVVRGRKRAATVTKMPFVPSKYWKGTAPA